MADQVLSVALEFLLNSLSTFVKEEAKLLGGLGQEIQFISNEFGYMKAFLEGVVEFNTEDDPGLAVWTRQVREAAYDIEDVRDEFLHLFARQRPRGFFGSVRSNANYLKNLPARHRLATTLQGIKAKIKNISEARQRYESLYSKSPAQVSSLPPANSDWRHFKDDEALYTKEDQLVGIDKPRQRLLSQILDSDSHLKVIAVLGMGGIGKTTLVKRVHSDADVENHFRIRAWVTVSQTFDFQELFKGLIRSLHAGFNESAPSSLDSMDIGELKACIRGLLERARYAIVLDDVWHIDFWDDFKSVLPENIGNCVILTTRIADVASSCVGFNRDNIFTMEYLTFEESMVLFRRKTFKDNSCPSHLEDVVKGIVKKCEGLPLAIVAIGGVLATKDLSRKEQWEQIHSRLGGESEGAGKLDRAKKILSLSFNELPHTLKTCLLYTSIYPEDCPINYLHLIQLWIAERIVEGGARRRVEDVAWDYIKELANRSLIQLDEMGYDGLPEHIQIHDLFREVIVCLSKKANMTTVIGTTQHTTINWPPAESVVRRLVFLGNNSFHNFVNLQSPQCYFNRLQSIHTIECTEPPSKALLSELLSSKFLKIVDFQGMQLEEIPKEIFSLFLLTHLTLRGSKVKMVPKSIKRLRNLEFFSLVDTNVRELPVEILKLRKLRDILLYQRVELSDGDSGYYGFKAPRNMGSLLELRRLKFLDAAESDETRIVIEIGKLTQLRTLEITNLRREDGKELCSSLEKLVNLMELTVSSSVGKDEVTVLDLNHQISASSLKSICFLDFTGRLETMPPWITNLQNLGEINLIRSSLMDDPLESLQHLPNLITVHLSQAYEGESLCFKPGGFQKLRKLTLRDMKGLRWMQVEEGAMPHIKLLVLRELPLVEEVPSGVEHLRELQELWLWYMSSEFREKLEGESEDYNNNKKRIGHVPKVYIDGMLV